jgi:DUF4097 and DUF4098 domain-containing protein YvlB
MRLFRSWLLTACVACAAPSTADADVTDRIARTVPLPAGTTLSVQITVGRVQVSTWERGEVSVEIVRRAPDAARLARIPAHVEQQSGRVSIRAVQAESARDADLRTDIVLRVPAAAALQEVSVFEGRVELAGLRGRSHVRVERGDIAGKALAGTIRLETAIGNISLEAATLSQDGLIRLRTFNGDVALGLAAKPADARILALSMGGTVTSDIPLTHQDRWGARFAEATLGRGEPVISIDVVNGDIVIKTRN